MRRFAVPLLALTSQFATACAGDDSATDTQLAVPDDGLPATCHPFRASGACSTPYPSDVWSVEDTETETGRRQALPVDLVPPAAKSKTPFEPARWNRRDGFSPATPIVAYFPERLDAASLPSQSMYDQSTAPTSATLIVDLETGEFVPHMSELDLSADIADTDRQPLIIRPARHLRPNRHYAVAITRSLRTLAGGEPETPVGFKSALRGAKSADPLARRALDALPTVLTALEAKGVKKSDLLLAWDFHTASLNQGIKTVLQLRDQALAKVGDAGLGFKIDSVEADPNAEIHARVRGTFKAPSCLSNDDRSVAETELVFDAAGKPVIQRDTDYPFELVIPKSAVDKGPYPLLVYGHGLLGSAGEVSGSHVRGLCNDKGYVCVATDWLGLSEKEEAGIGQSAAAVKGIEDVNRIYWVTDRLQQALVNFMVLTRVAPLIAADAQVLLPNGKSAIAAGTKPVYYGISQGGIMGSSLLAYSPDIERGVTQVGGTAYSVMIQRSVNWNQFLPAIRNAYPDRITQQVLMAVWQPLFDDSEGSGTAWAQGVNPGLPGTPEKHMLMQIAVGDSQVANLAAEIQARTLELPLLSPSSKSVWGLSESSGGVDNAIAFWDLVREPPPETNATPTTDNKVHGDIRKHPLNQEQTDVFLKTGKATNPCGGPCSFPGFVP
ncbi:MAG: hypothetical protein IPI67_41410 [Myxococcales bacterium]|nr:hypothetical protein [Myxococcales bacterium]